MTALISVHCRTGSLEKNGGNAVANRLVHCRTGSLETMGAISGPGILRSLPYRQLRKVRQRRRA